VERRAGSGRGSRDKRQALNYREGVAGKREGHSKPETRDSMRQTKERERVERKMKKEM
jgi:hypothetical protein